MLALCYFALAKSKVLYQKVTSTMLMKHLLSEPTKGGKCMCVEWGKC